MFGKMKELYDFQKKAREIQKELKNTLIEKEVGAVKVTINGEQKIEKVEINSEMVDTNDISSLERDIKSALDQAIQESQKIAADKMKDITGGLGIPGL
ncbi:MAG: YbaB/EbfC family nucleoid-associated protein [Patescibacteria group bacterium]|nr:YbaB/EbfC family nucleoid-associated protein [Patescibacteria group bacterium]